MIMGAEITLADPQGRTCTVGTPEEANNLLCVEPPSGAARAQPEPKVGK